MAIRRITDATGADDPTATIKSRLGSYTAGDTDLAWSRITYWRALLTSALDQPPHEQIVSATVSGLATEPALDIRRAGLRTVSTAGPEADGSLFVRTAAHQRRPHRDQPSAGRDHRNPEPRRAAGCTGCPGATRGPGLPRGGTASSRSRRDLRGRPDRTVEEWNMFDPNEIHRFADTDALVRAAASVSSMQWSRPNGRAVTAARRPHRRRYGDRPSRACPRDRGYRLGRAGRVLRRRALPAHRRSGA